MRLYKVTERTIEILNYAADKFRTLPEFKDFRLNGTSIDNILKHCDVTIARDNLGNLKGIMVTYFGKNFLDDGIKTLTLEAIASDSPRATVLLLDLFVDMGKKYADHLIMSKGVSTNLKASTLAKLGFKPLETIYKLEV